jgi:general secretion pathway protein D
MTEFFRSRPQYRIRFFVLALACAVVLTGCARTNAFNTGQRLLAEGRIEEGLKTLQRVVNENPQNQEYRIYYFRQRDILINQFLAQADDARLGGNFELAESFYRRVLSLDPNNTRGSLGLDRVQMDRRHKEMLADADALFKKKNVDAASARVRSVLAENPQSREGRALQRRIAEEAAKTPGPPSAIKTALTKPVTLEFRDTSIKAIFEVLSRVAGINFVLDRDIRADLRATLFVQNTMIDDIIKSLLVTNQLERKILNDTTILVYPNTPAKARDYQDLIVKSFYLANADAKQALMLIRTILRTRDVYIDEKLNLLVMRDTPEAIRLAEKLIANQDLAEPEVVLEVEVTEVKRSRLSELGIQYPNQFTVLNLTNTNTVTTSSGSVVATSPTISQGPLTLDVLSGLSSAKIGISPVILNLRSERSDANLLANPRIRVKNRDKARIHIGDRVPVITTTALANIGVTESVSYLDVGLRLEVEPTVNLEDEVGIRVGLEVSSIVREIKSTSGTLTYQIGTRSAATHLRLKDGETQALAGLINDEDRKTANKVPGLGDLPLLGRLFSNDRNDASKTEIILLITPHIVRNLVRPDASLTEFSSGTESSTGSGAFGPATFGRGDVLPQTQAAPPAAPTQPFFSGPATPMVPSPSILGPGSPMGAPIVVPGTPGVPGSGVSTTPGTRP